VLNRAVVLAFESRYSVTLYERGAWLCGRQHDRVWRGTVPQLREILGVPEKAYRNWTELRRNTLDLAVPEVDQLGHFTTTVSDADSDDAARVFRTYSAHRSNLMPPTILI